MSKFLSELEVSLLDDDRIWHLDSPLIYQSDLIGHIEVPKGFQTDFASVPRIPFIYDMYGDRAHRESVLHDYLYRIDSNPVVSFSDANDVFLEAMTSRGKPLYVRWAMWKGVCWGGGSSYHEKYVGDKL
jgi:hypothetical protein